MIKSKLSSHNLKLLAVALDSSDIYEHQLLSNMIVDKTGIDINTITELDDKADESLKKFEEENVDLLISIIVSSKRRGVSYILSHFLGKLSFNRILGFFVILFGCGYISYVTVNPLPENNVRFVDTVLGFVLGTMLSTVINFYFGSSTAPSSRKNDDKTNQ